MSETLPRLADALVEVSTRLGEIGAELHALVPSSGTASRGGARAADGTAPLSPPARPEPATAGVASAATTEIGEPVRADGAPPFGQPAAAPVAGAVHQPAVGPPEVGAPPRSTYRLPQPPPPRLFTDEPRSSSSTRGAVPPPPASTLWTRLGRAGAGSRILAWAGGVVTLAGVVLLLVLAVQRGYLGPLPRVLLGAGLGVALAGIGAALHRGPAARTGAYALAATGIAVLYLDVVAATALYGFLVPWGGLLTGLAVTAGGVALAGAWRSELLAVFVVVCCAVSAPVITGGFDALLVAFLLVLLLGTTPVQLARRWSGLLVAAALPSVVVALVSVGLAMGRGLTGDAALTAILAALTSGVVTVLAAATAFRRPGDEFAYVVLCLAAVPGLFAAVLLPRVGAALVPAALGVLLLCVWVLGHLGRLPRSFGLAAGGVAALAFGQATATAFDGDARAVAFLAEALVLTVLAVRLRLAAVLAPAAMFALAGVLLALVFPVNPDVLLRAQPGGLEVGERVSLGVTGLLFGAVALTLCWAAVRLHVLPGGDHAPRGWVPAGLLALYGSTGALLSVGLLVAPDRDGFLLGHVLVTVSWTVAALVLLLRGVDAVALRVAGLSLVVAALAKLVLFDLSSLDGMARVAAFLGAGLVLLAAGARYAKLVAARPRS